MGSCIYTQRKKPIVVKMNGSDVPIEIAEYKFAFKPYWDIFEYADKDYTPSWFNSDQRKILKMYRRELTRAMNLKDHLFLVFYKNSDGSYNVYNNPPNHWIIDDMPRKRVGRIVDGVLFLD